MDLEYYRENYQVIEQLFEGIPTEGLNRFEIVKYARDTPLTQEGQCDDRLFVILSGTVKILDSKPTGRRMTYNILTTGDVVGIYEILGKQPVRIATLLATTDVIVAVLSGKDLVEMFTSCTELSLRLCGSIIKQLNGTVRMIAQCNINDVYRSTITYLLVCYQVGIRQRKKDCNEPVKIMDSRQDIADFLGVDIRSINRAVECLKRESLVTIIKGKIHIDNDQFSRLTKIKESPIEKI